LKQYGIGDNPFTETISGFVRVVKLYEEEEGSNL